MKILLLPFSLVYGLIAWLRNVCYDLKILKSYNSKLKTIVIGNLQVGGSGKTPMTAYLYWMLSSKYNTAVLSRGYGRKTKGLMAADAQSGTHYSGGGGVRCSLGVRKRRGRVAHVHAFRLG